MMHDRLVEDLVPFLDRDIHDPKASQLASHPKRKHHDSAVRPSKLYNQLILGANVKIIRLRFCCGNGLVVIHASVVKSVVSG